MARWSIVISYGLCFINARRRGAPPPSDDIDNSRIRHSISNRRAVGRLAREPIVRLTVTMVDGRGCCFVMPGAPRYFTGTGTMLEARLVGAD